MAKLALINREEKRRKMVEKYAKRAELMADHQRPESLGRRALRARLKLQALPRNSQSGSAAQPLQ
jgi:small subunit ribosomal protein S14